VLLKGSFVRIPVLPSAEVFAELGPSFRLASNRNDTQPSIRGATGGLGIETILGPLSVSRRCGILTGRHHGPGHGQH
jgi:hypothetical protein